MKVCIESDIELSDLAGQISRSCPNNDIFEFIKTLDKQCQDWFITKKLHDYFKKEMKKFEGKKKKGSKNIQENN